MQRGGGTAEKPAVWPIFVTFALAFLSSAFLFAVVLGVLAARELAAARLPMTLLQQRYQEILARPWPSGAMLWASGGLWTLFAVGAGALSGRDLAGRLGLRATRGELTLAALVLVGMIGIGRLGSGLGVLLHATPGASLTMLAKTVGNAASSPHDLTPAKVFVLLGLGVTAAGEEIFFRGFAQTRLAARWGLAGVVVTAALFGAIHWDVMHSPIAFTMGLLLGWVSLRAGSIRPGIYAHVANNLAAPTLLKLVPLSGSWAGYALQMPLAAAMLALAVGGLFWRLSKRAA